MFSSVNDQFIYFTCLDDGRYWPRKTHCFLQGPLHLLVGEFVFSSLKYQLFLSVSNPMDTIMQPVSRTVGADRIVGR